VVIRTRRNRPTHP